MFGLDDRRENPSHRTCYPKPQTHLEMRDQERVQGQVLSGLGIKHLPPNSNPSHEVLQEICYLDQNAKSQVPCLIVGHLLRDFRSHYLCHTGCGVVDLSEPMIDTFL
jgi:hypothetical protein